MNIFERYRGEIVMIKTLSGTQIGDAQIAELEDEYVVLRGRHTIIIDGKPAIEPCNIKAYYGEGTRGEPEELTLAITSIESIQKQYRPDGLCSSVRWG